MERLRPVQLASGRQPFEVAFLIAAAIVGILQIVASDPPRSTDAAMSPFIQGLWEAGMAGGGLLGFVGVVGPWHLRPSGLAVELFSMATTGAVMVMYAVALIGVFGVPGLASGFFIGAFGLGCWGRFVQILRNLRRVARARTEGKIVDVPLLMERPPK